VYTDITPPCIRRAREVYTAVTRPCTGRPRPCRRPLCGRVRPCTRPCNVSCTRPCTRPCNVSCARYTADVYTAREHVCMDVFGRVHGAYTAPYTGRVHGHVRAVHTTVYTTRIRPRTHVYVYKGRVHGRVRAIYTAENDGRTRLCNVSCIRPRTRGRIGSCTRQCTGWVHGRFRSCTLAVYTAVFGHLHSAYTARVLGRYTAVYKGRVWAVYTAGRPTGPCTRSQTARYGRVRPVLSRPVYTAV